MESTPDGSRQKIHSTSEYTNEIYKFALKLILFPITSILPSSNTISVNSVNYDLENTLPSSPQSIPFIPFHRPTSFHLQDQLSTSAPSTQSQSSDSHPQTFNSLSNQHSSPTLPNTINQVEYSNPKKGKLAKLNDSNLDSQILSDEVKIHGKSSINSHSEKGSNRASIVQYAIYRTSGSSSVQGRSQIRSSFSIRDSSISDTYQEDLKMFSDEERKLLEVIGILFARSEKEILRDCRILKELVIGEHDVLCSDQEYSLIINLLEIILNQFIFILQGINRDISTESLFKLLNLLTASITSEQDEIIKSVINEFENRVKENFRLRFEEVIRRLNGDDIISDGAGKDSSGLLCVIQWVLMEFEMYRTQFVSKIGSNSISELFIEAISPVLLDFIWTYHNQLRLSTFSENDNLTLRIYQELKSLQSLAFDLSIDFAEFFGPSVRIWLKEFERESVGMITRAIDSDLFESIGLPSKISSSMISLENFLLSILSFVDNLEWSNEQENIELMQQSCQIAINSIERYSCEIEAFFMDELRSLGSVNLLDESRRCDTLYGRSLDIPSTLAVKLNNIYKLKQLLSKVFKPDLVNEQQSQSSTFLFNINVFLASNLSPLTLPFDSINSLNLSIILSDSYLNNLGQTRTIHSTTEPRWEENLPISIEDPLWIRVTLYHRPDTISRTNNNAPPIELGSGYIHLDSTKFIEGERKDIWLKLDSVENRIGEDARVLLQVTMEEEVGSEIELEYKRVKRGLDRLTKEMNQAVVDQITPVIRTHMLVKSIKSPAQDSKEEVLFSSVKNSLRKGFSRLSARRKSISGTKIPLKKHDISDLIQLLSKTLNSLNISLNAEAFHTLTVSIWKEVLSLIENSLLSSLSGEFNEEKSTSSSNQVQTLLSSLEVLLLFFCTQGLSTRDLKSSKYKEIMKVTSVIC